MLDVIAVDDEAVMRGLLTRIFDAVGWDAAVCSTGADALARLRTDGAKVLLTDINMPGLSGVDLARAARSEHPDLPIVAATASVDATGLDPTEFDCVLTKPFAVSRLLQTLSEYVAARTPHGA